MGVLENLHDTPLGVYTSPMKHMHDASREKIIRRLKLIEGQVRGLQKMIESDTYCIDVITQTSAVKQGLSNVEDLLLENHLGGCILDQVKTGQTEKAKQEILKVYKLKRK
jgi:DNA-binding FrmR family transcriptional regulator